MPTQFLGDADARIMLRDVGHVLSYSGRTTHGILDDSDVMLPDETGEYNVQIRGRTLLVATSDFNAGGVFASLAEDDTIRHDQQTDFKVRRWLREPPDGRLTRIVVVPA